MEMDVIRRLQKPIVWFALAVIGAIAGYTVAVTISHRPLAHVIAPACFVGVLLLSIKARMTRTYCGVGLLALTIAVGAFAHFFTHRVIVIDNRTDRQLPFEMHVANMANHAHLVTRGVMPADYEITMTFHIWQPIDPSLYVIDHVPDDPPSGMVTWVNRQRQYRVQRQEIPGGYKLTIDGPVETTDADPIRAIPNPPPDE